MKINRYQIPASFIVILSLLPACKEEEPAFETSTQQLIDVLVSTEWKIDLFFDGDNKTGEFAGFVFSFSESGIVKSTHQKLLQGTWEVQNDGRNGSKLVLQFDLSTELGLLTDEWRTVEISESFLRFEDVGGGPGEITQVNKLTLKKNT